MSAVTTILQALKTTDVLTRRDIGDLLDAECLPSAIDSTLATMCRRGLVERLPDADAYVLPSVEARERVAAPAKPEARTPEPKPAPVHAPNMDVGATVPSRVREVLGRCGPLPGAQIAELLPGTNTPSVLAMLSKMQSRGELRKHGRLFDLVPGYESKPSPWRQPMPSAPLVPASAQPEPVAAPEPRPEPVAQAPELNLADFGLRPADEPAEDALPFATTIELPGLRLRVEARCEKGLLLAVAAAVSRYVDWEVI